MAEEPGRHEFEYIAHINLPHPSVVVRDGGWVAQDSSSDAPAVVLVLELAEVTDQALWDSSLVLQSEKPLVGLL